MAGRQGEIALSTSGFTIRPGEVQDMEHITELLTELNRFEGYDRSASAQDLSDILFHENNTRLEMRTLLACDGDQPIGLVLFYWGYDTVSATTGYHLADIIVTSTYRGQGVGRVLYHALANQCLHEGGHWVSLTVLKKNTAAKAFYASLGMVEVAVDFYAIGPQALKALTIAK